MATQATLSLPGSGLRLIQLRRGDTCLICGTGLPIGSPALYHGDTKTFRCVKCPDSLRLLGDSPSSVDNGTAGASAQRRYDKLASTYESQAPQRSGGATGATKQSHPPQYVRAWEQGAQGERTLAETLEGLPSISLLHDRAVPRTDGNIDHIVVAPAGIYVVDSKQTHGRLEIQVRGSERRLIIGGRDRSKLAEGMTWQVAAVRRLLSSAGEDIPVTPVLFFVGATWPSCAPEQFNGVRLARPTYIIRIVTEPQLLSPADISRLAGILGRGLRAKQLKPVSSRPTTG